VSAFLLVARRGPVVNGGCRRNCPSLYWTDKSAQGRTLTEGCEGTAARVSAAMSEENAAGDSVALATKARPAPGEGAQGSAAIRCGAPAVVDRDGREIGRLFGCDCSQYHADEQGREASCRKCKSHNDDP